MPAEITATETTSGWFDRSGRARLEISGPDRAKFLHNLTTNDVKRLPEGQGQESFVTTLQGKTLAYVTLLASESNIFLRTETISLEGLAPHLARYGVFDDVSIADMSAKTFEFHLVGPGVGSIIGNAVFSLSPEGLLRHSTFELAGFSVRIVHESPTGSTGFTLIGSVDAADEIKAHFRSQGLVEFDASEFDARRIEAGTPLSGRDVTLANLPQEIGRDSKTINFVKGCYLGQETVARLDALGHVNRIFKGLTLEGSTAVPPDGSPLHCDGKIVGAITSAAFSQSWGCPIALGYVKVAQAVAGTKLGVSIEGSETAEAIVRDLPMVKLY